MNHRSPSNNQSQDRVAGKGGPVQACGCTMMRGMKMEEVTCKITHILMAVANTMMLCFDLATQLFVQT